MKKIIKTIGDANKRLKKWREELDRRKKALEEYPPQEPVKAEPADDSQSITVEISLMSVFKATLVVLGVVFLGKIAVELVDILVTFLIALFLAAAFDPAVNKMEKWGIPRNLGIILLFIGVFGFLIFLLGTLIPIIARQMTDITTVIEEWVRSTLNATDTEGGFFSEKFRAILGTVLERINSEEIIATINQNIESIATNLTNFAGKGLSIISSTVGAIFNFILVILLTFFMVLDKKNLNDFFHSLFPARHQQYLSEKMHLIQIKIGEWVHGQILLFFIVGTLTYITFSIIGIPYALTLAMVFGIAEFVPYVGPAFSFLVSAPVAFNDSFASGIGLIIFYVALQFIEGNVLVPWVMKRAVGLPPIVTIIALIVGASFPNIINPILGMIFAVPVATIVAIFVRDFTSRHSSEKKGKVRLWGSKKG